MNAKQTAILARLVLSLALASVFAFGAAGQASASGVIYVRAGATGANNGTSWANAYKNLPTALSHASGGMKIWVAKGKYKPTLATDALDPRTKTFILKNGVAIYGGFAGTETLLSQRNLALNVSTLSGDIGIKGDSSDNSYHVVTGSGTDSTAVLDGFTITGGNANGDFVLRTAWGGGMFNSLGGPTLKNLIFRGNAAGYGAGMANDNGSPTLFNVMFNANTAVNNAGGMYNVTSTPKLVNVTFSGNVAGFEGGGMHNETGGTPILTNVTFSANTAAVGGGMDNYASSPMLSNVTFSGNTASTGGGMKNGVSNPTLTNVTFRGNSATSSGDGMYNDSSAPFIYDSIFWGDGVSEIEGIAATPTIVDTILEGGACPTGGACTNVSGADPVLGALQNNGGFTQTMALGAGSAAIDQGNSGTCATTDQRGVARPQGGACDMGAYEVRAMSFRSTGAYDGQVLESASGSNAGGSVNASGLLHVGDDGSDRRFRDFLSFNTARLPDGATIALARITVRQQASPTGNPFGTEGNLVADLAKPYFGAGLELVSTDWQASTTVSSVGTFLPDGSLYWSALNSAGRSHISKLGTTQLRLRFTLRDSNHLADYLTLYSGNDPTAANRPMLSVYYNP